MNNIVKIIIVITTFWMCCSAFWVYLTCDAALEFVPNLSRKQNVASYKPSHTKIGISNPGKV